MLTRTGILRSLESFRANRRWVRQRAAAENGAAAVGTLAQHLRLSLTQDTIHERLTTHPQFPGLPALLDCLRDWSLAPRAVRARLEQLQRAALPALAQISSNGEGRFVVVLEANGSYVRYVDPTRGTVETACSDFATIWTGILILVTPQPGAGEEGYGSKRRLERLEAARLPLLAAVGAVALGGSLLGGSSIPSVIVLALVVLKLAGLALSALLSWLSIDPGAHTAKLCPAGRVVNCESVLSSPGAKLFGFVPLADLGTLYFFGGLIALGAARFANTWDSTLALLCGLTLAGLPLTLFSVGYQGFVLKQWCWMCLGVMGVLWLEFFSFSITGHLHFVAALSPESLSVFCFAFLAQIGRAHV